MEIKTMLVLVLVLVLAISVALTGCAHIEFGDPATGEPDGKGLIYFEPQPYLLVQKDEACVVTASSVVLPGKKKQMLFKTGYGSGNLSANLSNGMIASVGQESSGANEAITAIAALAAVVAMNPDEASSARAASKKESSAKPCPNAMLYPIENGAPQMGKGFPIIPSPENP